MNFRKRRKTTEMGMIRLPLIALIDVVLFILLYFMLAGTFSGDEARLAAAISTERRGGGRGSDLSTQVLYVESSAGAVAFRVGTRSVANRAELAALLRQLPREPGIVIRAADEVPVSAAAAAMQTARDAGFTRVSYVAGK